MSFGKRTQSALYFHRSWLLTAPAATSVKVVRTIRHIPDALGWNIVKVAGPFVSFLFYPDFDSKAHPALTYSIRVNSDTGKATVTNYQRRANPFILHRKDLLVSSSYPHYKKFRRQTLREEKRGLLNRRDIGTKNGWAKAIADRRDHD